MTWVEMDHMIKETLDVIRKGYYKCGNQRVNLSLTTGIYNYERVEVYSPTQLVDIFCDTDHFMREKFYEPYNHTIKVLTGASYEVAKDYLRPLIMNLADAINPGGGCIPKKKTNEFQLVYATSLYLSLSSQEASQVYLFNENCKSPMFSDYMLLSREIAVFRDSNKRLLLHPYPVAVLSMMPVERCQIPRSESKEYEIDTIMKMRIRLFFYVAARNMYRNLILVPAGFEDYGHSPYKTAQYFYDILIKEDYIDFFEQIIFSFDQDSSKVSMQVYEQVFHYNSNYKRLTQSDYGKSSNTIQGKIASKQMEQDQYIVKQQIQVQSVVQQRELDQQEPKISVKGMYRQSNKKYIQALYPFPECNYTLETNRASFCWGYAQGILEDGVPFAAELMQTKKQQITAVFILPYLNQMNQISQMVNNKDSTRFTMKKYDIKKPVDIWNSILCQGMQHYEKELQYEVIDNYISYLIYMNLLEIQKSDIEGFAHVLYDRAGHKVVAIEITLKNFTRVEGIVPLRFQPFTREMITEDKVESRLRIT